MSFDRFMYPLFLHDYDAWQLHSDAIRMTKRFANFFSPLMNCWHHVQSIPEDYIDALMDTVWNIFHITEQQLEEFNPSLFSGCQSYMQKHGVRFSGCLSAIL